MINTNSSATLPNERPRLRHRFTREEVSFLVQSELLQEGTIELIDGDIVEKMPKKETHVFCSEACQEVLDAIYGRAHVRAQQPVALNTNNEPEPDVAVTVRTKRDYLTLGTPPAGDILLVVEVSDSTRTFDLTTKATLYAQAMIPEYWVLDVNSRELHVHTSPTQSGYQNVVVLPDTATVAVNNATISLADLLP
jgi:Uma2 family endonuclease